MTDFLQSKAPGLKSNAIRWLQKKVMQKASELPKDFADLAAWETFKTKLREELPRLIGIPQFPRMQESFVCGKAQVGEDVQCERVDVYVDDDYSIPAFVFSPLSPRELPGPALVWNPGWSQDKWQHSYQQFALRMAKHGFVVLILDHAPFGETSFPESAPGTAVHTGGMTLVMGMGQVLGISQLALRAAETMRCREYLCTRADVDSARIAVAGLCQGGQDTWLSAALDDGFCVAAPFCSESTFAIHFADMGSYRTNSDTSPFPFGILNICDIEHLHAAIAPRPLLVRSNLGDNWWPLIGFTAVEAFTRKIYGLYEADEKVDFRMEAHEHDLTGVFADALEAFLLEHV